MTHAEFVAGLAKGRLSVTVNNVAAVRFLSQRMMLPWLLLPLFGLAVALALTGRLAWSGLVLAGALGLRSLVRMSAKGYVHQRAIADSGFFAQAVAAGALEISTVR